MVFIGIYKYKHKEESSWRWITDLKGHCQVVWATSMLSPCLEKKKIIIMLWVLYSSVFPWKLCSVTKKSVSQRHSGLPIHFSSPLPQHKLNWALFQRWAPAATAGHSPRPTHLPRLLPGQCRYLLPPWKSERGVLQMKYRNTLAEVGEHPPRWRRFE